MIPRANITAWRATAPWADDTHVEQDLVLSRSIVELFTRPAVGDHLAFRGGTALHKLFFEPPGRYSEDLDLVQRKPGPIGPIVREVRAALDPWLDQPKYKSGRDGFTVTYRFETTMPPIVRMRVKVEINTREHFAIHGFVERPFSVTNPWFTGSARVPTYSLSELLATKLRALYQRKKGRDLFDLALGFNHPEFAQDDLLEAFEAYMHHGETAVTRAQFERTMTAKMNDPEFLADVSAIIRPALEFDPQRAWTTVHKTLVSKLSGEPWKGLSKPD